MLAGPCAVRGAPAATDGKVATAAPTGEVAAQVGGTDNDPIEAAFPTPADTAVPNPPNPPRPGAAPPRPLLAAMAASSAASMAEKLDSPKKSHMVPKKLPGV
ncbi:hypothetical protein MPS_3936 [Mycobacterium pseudoshottsii JCM 15466]|nr:hypothetical protein MPS_3936 [Mycobacterium pseudoshottsii JCM 15466]